VVVGQVTDPAIEMHVCRGGASLSVFLELFHWLIEIGGHIENGPLTGSGGWTAWPAWTLADEFGDRLLVVRDNDAP
jgi:hypothetical protein